MKLSFLAIVAMIALAAPASAFVGATQSGQTATNSAVSAPQVSQLGGIGQAASDEATPQATSSHVTAESCHAWARSFRVRNTIAPSARERGVESCVNAAEANAEATSIASNR